VARLEEIIGRSIRLYKQSELTSISEQYSRAPEKFSSYEGLDRGPNIPTSSKGLKRESDIGALILG